MRRFRLGDGRVGHYSYYVYMINNSNYLFHLTSSYRHRHWSVHVPIQPFSDFEFYRQLNKVFDMIDITSSGNR